MNDRTTLTLKALTMMLQVPMATHGDSTLMQALRQFTNLAVMDRIALIRLGIPASLITTLAEALGLTKAQIAAGLGIPVSSVTRKLRARTTLSAGESERVLGLVELVVTVEGWGGDLSASAPPDFVASRWLGSLLATPAPALGGLEPLSLLVTADGRGLVAELLGSQEVGAYW